MASASLLAKTVVLSFMPFCISLCSTSEARAAQTYQESVEVDKAGIKKLTITNLSPSPIAAYVVVEIPAPGLEGHSYYDEYLDSHAKPIQSGSSKEVQLEPTSVAGSGQQYVRAVVFEDGSSDGDPEWINVILGRRVRSHDGLVSMSALLTSKLQAQISRSELVDLLRSYKAKQDKERVLDDFRVPDDLICDGAISTFSASTSPDIDRSLRSYLSFLSLKIAGLESSRPDLKTLRSVKQAVPASESEKGRQSSFRPRDLGLQMADAPQQIVFSPSSCPSPPHRR